MLFKFKSQAAGDVIMLAPHAHQVLEAIGKEPAERGVILAADMPAAITALEQAMKASEAQTKKPDQDVDEQGEADADDSVPFYARAQPFLDLLKVSHQQGKDIVWGV